MTLGILNELLSLTKESYPPRAIQWAFFELTESWTENQRDDSHGWYNLGDAALYLRTHREEYKEFLNKYKLKNFFYDDILFKVDYEASRTEW